MSAIPSAGTSTVLKTTSGLWSYLNNASAFTGKAWLVAAGTARDSTTAALHYLVEKDSTGLLRIAVSRLQAGDTKSWIILGTSLFASYAVLCSALRFRRRDAMAKKYGYTTRESMAKMTTTEAQEILQYMNELEFPRIFTTSLEFALFKTYGIPTISGLLTATREFSDPATSSKRLADTSILIGEFASFPPTSERSIKAISRMNYIHSGYQASGKISQDDLLYTLSVFMTEPLRWVSRYEWREFTPMELCAVGTFWKGMADSMGIEYQSRLRQGLTGWRDGLEFWEDVAQWAGAYEERYMVPAISNKKTADETSNLLLHLVPLKLRPYAMKAIAVVMEDRLRRSMMYPDPPASYTVTIGAIFETRRFLLRYLSLPRPEFLRVRGFHESPDPATGRYHYDFYKAHPYYTKPSFWNRWGPEALLVWVAGGDVPGSKGQLFYPQGYKLEEVGPKKMVGKGKERTDEWEAKLAVERTGGCPFRR